MSEKLRLFDIIIICVLIILCSSLVIGLDKGYIGLPKTEQNYINADEWVEKCTEYENYEKEDKLHYNTTSVIVIHCQNLFDTCLLKKHSDICLKEYKTCKQKMSEPFIITTYKTRCVEIMLVKKNSTYSD